MSPHFPSQAEPPAPRRASTSAASLVVLMLHRAHSGPGGNSAAALDALFAEIAAQHQCVLPGEALAADRLNVCLSFDDGYLDFHRVVVPLLHRHGLRALLAIAPGLIRETCDLPDAIRFALPDTSPDSHTVSGGLCTWEELREIVASGCVEFAAHGLTHARLDGAGADLTAEIVEAKAELARRLGVRVESFVFPHGRFSRAALALVRAHYRFALRIGNASNRAWSAPLLYRVAADGLAEPSALFAPAQLRRYRRQAWWNRLRGR